MPVYDGAKSNHDDLINTVVKASIPLHNRFPDLARRMHDFIIEYIVSYKHIKPGPITIPSAEMKLSENRIKLQMTSLLDSIDPY